MFGLKVCAFPTQKILVTPQWAEPLVQSENLHQRTAGFVSSLQTLQATCALEAVIPV